MKKTFYNYIKETYNYIKETCKINTLSNVIIH